MIDFISRDACERVIENFHRLGGSLAQWIAHWTLNREVESSNPPGGAGGKMDKTSGS